MAWPRRQQTEREPVSAADDVHAEPAVISRPTQQWSSCSAASAEPATVEGSQSIGGQATSRPLSSSALGVFSISIAADCGRDDSGAQPEEGDPVTVTAAGTATVTEDGEWQIAAQQTTRGRTAAVTMGEAERLPAVSHGSGARTVSSDWARRHRLQARSRTCSLIRSWGVVSVPTDGGTTGSGTGGGQADDALVNSCSASCHVVAMDSRLGRPRGVVLADGWGMDRLTEAVQDHDARVNGSSAPCRLVVMDRLCHEAILGLPWLRAGDVVLSCGPVITWYGKPLPSRQGLGIAHGRAAEDWAQLQQLVAATQADIKASTVMDSRARLQPQWAAEMRSDSNASTAIESRARLQPQSVAERRSDITPTVTESRARLQSQSVAEMRWSITSTVPEGRARPQSQPVAEMRSAVNASTAAQDYAPQLLDQVVAEMESGVNASAAEGRARPQMDAAMGVRADDEHCQVRRVTVVEGDVRVEPTLATSLMPVFPVIQLDRRELHSSAVTGSERWLQSAAQQGGDSPVLEDGQQLLRRSWRGQDEDAAQRQQTALDSCIESQTHCGGTWGALEDELQERHRGGRTASRHSLKGRTADRDGDGEKGRQRQGVRAAQSVDDAAGRVSGLEAAADDGAERDKRGRGLTAAGARGGAGALAAHPGRGREDQGAHAGRAKGGAQATTRGLRCHAGRGGRHRGHGQEGGRQSRAAAQTGAVRSLRLRRPALERQQRGSGRQERGRARARVDSQSTLAARGLAAGSYRARDGERGLRGREPHGDRLGPERAAGRGRGLYGGTAQLKLRLGDMRCVTDDSRADDSQPEGRATRGSTTCHCPSDSRCDRASSGLDPCCYTAAQRKRGRTGTGRNRGRGRSSCRGKRETVRRIVYLTRAATAGQAEVELQDITVTVGRTHQKILDRTQLPRLAEEQRRAGQHEALEVLEMEWLSEMKRMDEGLAAAMEIGHATASANDVLTPGCDTEAEREAEQLAAHRQREARAAGSRQQPGSRPWSSASAASPAHCAGGGDGGATRAAMSDAQQRGRRILMPWCAAARHREAQSGDESSRSGAEEMQHLSEDELVERQEALGEPDAEKDRRRDQGDEEVARRCRGRTTEQQQQQPQQGGIHRQQDRHDCHSAVTVGVGQQADAAKQGVIEARTWNQSGQQLQHSGSGRRRASDQRGGGRVAGAEGVMQVATAARGQARSTQQRPAARGRSLTVGGRRGSRGRAGRWCGRQPGGSGRSAREPAAPAHDMTTPLTAEGEEEGHPVPGEVERIRRQRQHLGEGGGPRARQRRGGRLRAPAATGAWRGGRRRDGGDGGQQRQLRCIADPRRAQGGGEQLTRLRSAGAQRTV